MTSLDDHRRRNLDALLGIAGTSMLTAGTDLVVRSLNHEAERLLGISREEAVGKSCREVLGPQFCTDNCALRATLDARKPRRDWAVRVMSRDGHERDLLIDTVFLEVPDPEGCEVAVALRDVTESERLRRALQERWTFHGLVCASGKMKEIVTLVRELARYDSTVLVLGESGTGKELIARGVHEESERHEQPFVTVNCAAYSEGLLESELFGHVRGAFTGAVQDREGRFASASGGTVFLDEIGEISPKVQVKLLRVLQDHVVERVGDQKAIPVDIRVVAATHRNLEEAVSDGTFREDLYYRLNVITVDIPPLRERLEDVPALVEHFLRAYSEKTGKSVLAPSEGALDLLLRHTWPGNVRELENAIEHGVVRARGPVLAVRDLPAALRGESGGSRSGAQDLEARIDAALATADGRVGRAAEILGVHRTTIWRHLKRRK